MVSNSGFTAQLAENITNLQVDDIPTHVWDKAGLSILDTMGAMWAGAKYSTPFRMAVQTANILGGTGNGNCTVISQGNMFSPGWAAFVNGIAAHAIDLDDSHRFATGYHPGATVIPACIAVAEMNGSSIEEFRLAIIAGYEVAGRIGRAINPSHRYRGFHSTGTIGVFGAAVGAGKLLGLDSEKMTWAMGIAGSMAGGVFEFLNGMAPTKLLHAGHAAMAGVMAATLASQNFEGPTTILEGKEGFLKAYSDEVCLDVLTDDFGHHFEMEYVYFKPYAACGHAFSSIDAGLELRKRNIKPEFIDSIKVETYRAAAVLDKNQPSTLHQAEFSIPFLVSLALNYGSCSISDIQQGLNDSKVLDLAQRVTVYEAEECTRNFPNLRTAIVNTQLSNGWEELIRVDFPRGMPENPMSSNELIQKFRELTIPIIGDESASIVADSLLQSCGSLKDILNIPIVAKGE